MIRDHVLLAHASDLAAADARLAPLVTADLIDYVLATVPDALLLDPVNRDEFRNATDARARYHDYLRIRLSEPRLYVEEAIRAKELRANEPVQRRTARR
jgi:hypothetical protein